MSLSLENYDLVQIAVFSALGLLLLVFFAVWLMTRIRYRITPDRLQVTLFGLPVRQMPLTDIESIGKRRTGGWSELWYNTTRPSHRRLIIRRSRGLFRSWCISPRNRYVFKADLERAIARKGAPEREVVEKVYIVSD